VWLEWHSPTIRILAHRSGALIFVNSGVYTWRDTEAVQKGIGDCNKLADPLAPPQEPPPDNQRDLTVRGAIMKRLDAKEEIEVIGFGDVSNAVDYEINIALEASVGPYLFVREGLADERCGAAHQNHSEELVAFDLGNKTRPELWTKGDVPLLRQRALALDGRNLQKCVDDNRASMDPPGPTTLDSYGLKSVLPHWTPKEGMRFHLLFTIMPNFVTGERRCETDVDRAPEALAAHPPPAALSALVRQMPDFEVRGWSVLRAADAIRVPAVTQVLGTRESNDESKPK
jgi:hypothetical protein